MEDLVQLSCGRYIYFLQGVLVMFMAPALPCSKLVWCKQKYLGDSDEECALLLKPRHIFLIICHMYGGGGMLIGSENTVDDVLSSGGDVYYSARSDFFFQVVFVATAMSIISGAVAERMKLWSFLLFAVVMTGFIYPFQGSWSWGGGFLSDAGFIDFAGSGIVHMCGAAAALAGVLLLGPRNGKYGPNGEINPIPGSMPLTTLGMFILWFGWFGFNGGWS